MNILLLALGCLVASVNGDAKPNILLILVDDFGWNNVGYHRKRLKNVEFDAEVNTPNLDNLVKSGIELNRHYTYNYCSPSRSSLQSGRLPVHVSVENTEPISVNPDDPISGYSGIPTEMTGIAEKLKTAGYKTAMTGKWDAGFAHIKQIPTSKGYEQFFGYFHHANDYYTETLSGGSTVHLDLCAKEGEDLVDLWLNDKPAFGMNGTRWEEHMFTEHSVRVINEHDTKDPLFLFHSFHIVHTPLQIPAEHEKRYGFLHDEDRRKYAAMVEYMDSAVGEMVAALEKKGMWDNTLLILSSDNGGPIYGSVITPGHGFHKTFGAASNGDIPKVPNNRDNLRGGKTSDWEGGIRVNAFASGGFIPQSMRGTKVDDIIHITDWYSTLCSIAGVDSHDLRAEQANLPPVDGIDHSPLLTGKVPLGNGKRKEVHVSRKTLIQVEDGQNGKRHYWKLLTGNDRAIFQTFPENLMTFDVHANGYGLQAIKSTLTPGRDCSKGCLFDVYADPGENNELTEQYPDRVAKMMARLQELNKNNFNPDRGTPSGLACKLGKEKYNGFYGPFVGVGHEVTKDQALSLTQLQFGENADLALYRQLLRS